MNKIRNFFFIILILNAVTANYTQNSWEIIESPVNETLHNIFFIDNLYGWAAGELGTLIKTTNGGTDWQMLNNISDTTVWSIHFINKNSGWAVSWLDDTTYNGTLIHKTTNGGMDWQVIEFPQGLTYIEGIYFLDSLNGFAGVNYSPVRGPIYYTTDGGFNWALADVQPDTLNYPFLPVKRFYSSGNNLFACGGAFDIAGVIWKSTNNGITWEADSTVAPDPINELHFFDSLNIIGTGGDREFFYGVGIVETTDGGNFWDYREIEILGVATCMDFRTPNEGWASMGFLQTFIYTADSGYSWKEISTPNNSEINDILFLDTAKGFAVGKDGVILKYEYKPNSVNNEIEILPEKFFLFQNFPNPFNPTTKIKFTIPNSPLSFLPGGRQVGEGQGVRLVVYDVLGNEVAVLLNEEKLPGEYEVKFDASGLSSGIYYYKLTAEDFSSVKKMILLK